MRYFVSVVVFFLLYSCMSYGDTGNSNKAFSLSVPVEIGYQETVRNRDEDITLTFNSVEDSRCPQDVKCVWEGNAAVTFTLLYGADSVRFVLNTYRLYERETTAFGFRIQLLDVAPYPHTSYEYKPEDYSASVVVSR